MYENFFLKLTNKKHLENRGASYEKIFRLGIVIFPLRRKKATLKATNLNVFIFFPFFTFKQN